jgi:hypothetical protein
MVTTHIQDTQQKAGHMVSFCAAIGYCNHQSSTDPLQLHYDTLVNAYTLTATLYQSVISLIFNSLDAHSMNFL